jgi:hypothetical protein
MADINQTAPLGFGQAAVANPQQGPDTFTQSSQRLQREQAASTGDYVGSIWRQDGLVDAILADQVGRQMSPDLSFDPFSDPQTKELQKSLWPEFQPYLLQAHSGAHQVYLHSQLMQKQEDLTRLGDMGVAGNVGRIALNVVMPDQLLMSMAGGWAAKGIRLVRGAEVAGGAGLAAAEARAGAAAAAASKASSRAAVFGGLATAAAENAAYEKLRQSVNFEDDSSGIVEAGLLGAAISSPFVLAGARQASRVAAVAEKEHQVLQALRAAHEGEVLTPEQGKLIQDVVRTHEAIKRFEAGQLDEAGVEHALSELHGPQEPSAQWLERYHGQLRQDAQQIIQELFPGHEGRSTGLAEPSPAQRAQMDQKVALEDTNFAPDVTHAAPAEPPKTAMQLAFERANQARVEKAQANEQLRKAFDLEQAHAGQAADAKAAREAAHAQAEEDLQAQKLRDQERMINERELVRMAGEHPVDAAVAPQAPVKAPEQAPDLAGWVGRDVSWAHPQTGDTVAGTVTSVSPTGKLVVDTHEGPSGMRAVAHTALDQYDGPAPSGFLHGSVGSAQREAVTSIAAQRTRMAEMSIPGTNVKVPTRLDIYANLNGSPVEHVRKLAYKLVKDAIQNDSHEAQAMTASEWKKQFQRTIAGAFHRESKEAFNEAITAAKVRPWQVPQFAHEFYRLVSRVTRGDTDALAVRPELAPMLQKASAAQRKAYAEMLAKAKEAGVKGAQDVEVNDAYVNRIWDHQALREASSVHGQDNVVRVVAEAFKDKAGLIERFKQSPEFKAHPDMTDEAILQRKAKGFLKAVRSLEFSPALQDIVLAGRDMHTLRSELASMDVPQQHIDSLIDVLFEAKGPEGDAGTAGNLKFRMGLDETTKVTTKAGELRLSDLFENDARVLVDRYLNSMAGHTALAKVGIRSHAEWAAEIRKVSKEALDNASIDGNQVAKDIALLEDVHRHITGRPMSTQDFSYANRTAAAFRAYTRAVMLPQLGIAAAFEMSKAVAMMGFKSLQQLPSLRSLLIAMRQGYIPDEGLARDIMTITGFGQEKVAAYHRMQEIENGFMGQALTRAELGANVASHAVDVLSGNASITSLTKQLSGMMAVQNMHDYATGRRVLTDSMRERWVGQGVSTDDIEHLLGKLQQYAVAEDGVVKQVRHEDWLKESPGTYEQFQTFLSRQVRDAIQDHDLGESMPFMHTTLGKVFAELRTFMLVGHAKNFLKNLAYHDQTALQVFAIGFIGEALAYSMQTVINAPDKLDERLTPEAIARAAYFRMASLGTASFITETGFQLLSGGDSLVQPGTTANTDSRSLLNTPSLILAKRLLNAPSTLGGLVLGTDVTTQQEARDLWGVIPGANLYGLKAAGNWWTNQFPKSDPEKARQRP